MDALKPCPFCGGKVEMTENWMRMSPTMGKQKPAQLLSVSVVHHCPRETDENGNYRTLHQFIEVRGRDHEAAVAAWNRRMVG